MAKIPLAAVSDQGRCAPIRAQARPSKIKYLHLVTFSRGTSERERQWIQSHSSRVTEPELEVAIEQYALDLL